MGFSSPAELYFIAVASEEGFQFAKRYALRDDQWERIQDLLPGRAGHVGGTAKDNRRFVQRSCTAIAPAFPGVTSPCKGLGISAWCILAYALE